MMNDFFPLRPVLCTPDTPGARPLAGGWTRYAQCLTRGGPCPADRLAASARAALETPRPAICGLSLDRPRIMGIVNVTPDSFSDGGRYADTARAVAHGQALVAEGADMLDIGGESTRPGSATVSDADEIARVVPVIEGLRAAGITTPISIDTRKPAVARAAVAAGAGLWNDVAALTYAPEAVETAAELGVPVCLMHYQGTPETMQVAPHYEDVVAEVALWLEQRVAACEAAGIPRGRILVDPGIGFGKTVAHNLALIRALETLHASGCAILLGVSRKRFIGTIGQAPEAADRAPGSIALGLAGLARGAQVLRVHDVRETVQAVRLWSAVDLPSSEGDTP